MRDLRKDTVLTLDPNTVLQDIESYFLLGFCWGLTLHFIGVGLRSLKFFLR